MSVPAYLALGSNLGDRRAHLEQAVADLKASPDIRVGRLSSLYETAPVGGPAGQGPYLNAALEVETSLDPDALLRLLLSIEERHGRVRAERFGPRTLDLDLLLFGELV